MKSLMISRVAPMGTSPEGPIGILMPYKKLLVPKFLITITLFSRPICYIYAN